MCWILQPLSWVSHVIQKHKPWYWENLYRLCIQDEVAHGMLGLV